MILGESLIEAGLVEDRDIHLALERQQQLGGPLGQNLVALGLITPEQLDHFFNMMPPPVRSVADTGLDPTFLMTLALKIMNVFNLDTASRVAEEIKLPATVVASVIEDALERGLLEDQGIGRQDALGEHRYTITNKGRQWVSEALALSQYVGPAPISLAAYQLQVGRQRITNDRVDLTGLEDCFSHLVLPDGFLERIGPAINSGRAMLLYGPPGNGKTSIAFALAHCFRQCVYVPYCIEVDGQIIKVYDPMVHSEALAVDEIELEDPRRSKVLRDDTDRRWLRCRRPVAITGGELTLDMLDLAFNDAAKTYEAPLQMKASGGLVVIDDFGRQRVQPEQVLNRWIVPLEKGFDFLTLQSGRKFKVPFDGLVIFSTNMSPNELMDPAMLRRIPYNFLLDRPMPDEYDRIFETTCQRFGLEYSPDVVVSLMSEFYGVNGLPLARYHPNFILDHVIAHCRYTGEPPRLERDIVLAAAEHLYTKKPQAAVA
ncbi:MAG: hypothetical protein AAF495_27580 [Pseudomonadota bacterium]